MSETVNRKVFLYSLTFKRNNSQKKPFSLLPKLIKKIFNKKDEYIFKILSASKYIKLDNCQIDEDNKQINLLMHSGRYNFRPDLFDVESYNTRENPTTKTEAPKIPTFISINYQSNKELEIFVALESKRGGVSISKFIEFVTHFPKKYHEDELKCKIEYSIIVGESFLKSLETLKRAKLVKITTQRKYFGSEFEELAKKTPELQNEMDLELRANRGNDIKGFVKSFYHNHIESRKEKVTRIRVQGYDEYKGLVNLDSEKLKVTENITCEVNSETGVEINDSEIFAQLQDKISTQIIVENGNKQLLSIGKNS